MDRQFSPGDDTVLCLSLPIAFGQELEVYFVRQAEWDSHWVMVFRGVSGRRREIRRFCSYNDARQRARYLSALFARFRRPVSA